MGTVIEKFQKYFRKPWSSIYSTEMFSKWFWTNKVGHGGKRSGGFKRKDIGDNVLTRGN
jgi:hypothetical protein